MTEKKELLSNKIRMSVVIPTRGRHKLLQINWRKFLYYSKCPHQLGLSLYIDEDDKKSIDTYHHMKSTNPNISAIIGKRHQKLAVSMNIAAYNSIGDYLAFMGDDYDVSTKFWDQIFIDAINKYDDKIVLACGDDGYKHAAPYATSFCIHRNWLETIGYVFPLYFMSWGNDTYISKISQKIGRFEYIESLKIIHNRKIYDKTKHDRYKSNKNHKEIWRRQEVQEAIKLDAQKLLNFINSQKK